VSAAVVSTTPTPTVRWYLSAQSADTTDAATCDEGKAVPRDEPRSSSVSTKDRIGPSGAAAAPTR